ncbi:hypothetical protein D5S18_18800 [Nocardia panacis]|uniref:Uncharacterized protein n=1 Tax=Nocardia panacis TaxID=2340916 RepID=A0A3A4JUY9_9NOCA|nr:hypothetical protein [Nocardia panacis]RJO74011.1 hypothetical protein D5S18_18800 [Nocardia panacis]
MNPAKQYFEALRTWAYPQASRYADKATFRAAIAEAAERINTEGRYSRSPDQIDRAVTNCTDWIWSRFIGEGTAARRTIALHVSAAVDQVLQVRADTLGITVDELATRWVLAGLATEVIGSGEILELLAKHCPST